MISRIGRKLKSFSVGKVFDALNNNQRNRKFSGFEFSIQIGNLEIEGCRNSKRTRYEQCADRTAN